jgi:hypothetical protein
MNTPEIIHGTLKPDGTLELDQKPTLPPGQVMVTVQALTPAMVAPRGLATVIDEIRQGQQARGFVGRSAPEIEAGRLEGEAEYEQRMQTVRGQTEFPPPSGGS